MPEAAHAVMTQQRTVVQRPGASAWDLSLGQAICSRVGAGLDREWYVTNGIGGYASGSLNGATTRSYHGLLVAALHPPAERDVLVTKIDEEVTLSSGAVLRLGVNEYQDGTIDPQGYHFLETFTLEGDVACLRYALNEALFLEKRIWMEYGKNTTYVQYTLNASFANEADSTPLTLTLYPFCLYRSHHSTTRGAANWRFLVAGQGNRCQVRAYQEAPQYTLTAGPSAQFSATGNWYWHVLHRRDTERGLLDVDDVYQPGTFQLQIAPGERATLLLSAEEALADEFGGPQHEESVNRALQRHQQLVQQRLATARPAADNLPQQDPVLARLVLAADQFIVARAVRARGESPEAPLELKTVIAGYPWFTDWGRDSMISLPGLLLSTARYSEARSLLRAFAAFTHNGLIPNRFPDSGETPEYNSIDATLWMFHALDRYLASAGDWSLLNELFLTLSDIIMCHVRGTAYAIAVDPADGLLRGGTPGVQLTWMDAKVGDWVVTPRHGKPVEVNALWFYALCCMESWTKRLSLDPTLFSLLRAQVQENFARRFWYEEGGYLYDVIDVEGNAGRNDAALRPNQLFAAALTPSLLSEEQVRSMLDRVTGALLTPLGLRSLSPDDPAYCKHFNGNQQQRDGAYHRGTVWPWLIGAYVDISLRIYNDRAALRLLFQPLVEHLWDACLGTISEVAEPEAPFTPAGCFAQAWSVAEVLRSWLALQEI